MSTLPPPPYDEQLRLKALRELDVVGTAPEKQFEALVRAAALVCGTPISLISLIEEERQWFKANVGLDGVSETSRDVSFCAHAICQNGIFEVEDALEDQRFSNNPLVLGDPGIRFYAGAPLELASGQSVGALCVIDRQPRRLNAHQKEVLGYLAYAAARALEARIALQSEQQLRRTEAHAASILENSPDAIITVDLDGKISHCNGAAERLFMLRAQDMIGRSSDLLIPGLVLGGREWSIGQVRKVEEGIALRNDGSLFPIAVSAGPVVSHLGQVIGVTAIVHDITDLIAARSEVHKNQEMVRRLYEATPAIMHSVDPAGRILSVSDRWLDTLGYQRDEVIGRLSTDFLTEQSRSKARGVLADFFQTGRCEGVHYQMQTKSGAVIDVLLSAILERDSERRPIRSLAVIEDITLRIQAEARLGEEAVRLRNIIDGTEAGTWELNVQTDEIRLNDTWAHIVGLEHSDHKPKSFTSLKSLIHLEDLPSVEQRLLDHLNEHVPRYEVETRMRHKDGHWVWGLVRGKVITRSADGRAEWVFGTLQDVSARKSIEEALRKERVFLDRTGQVAGVGGWEVDLRTESIIWSDETCRIHGVAPGYRPTMDEAISFYAPEARPVIHSAVTKSLSTGDGWDLELPFIRADGKRIWVRAVGSVEFDGDTPVRISGAFQDITARVEERLELERLNQQMEAATENGRIGIWDADLQAGRTFYSDMWCELLGYSREEFGVSIDSWIELVHPDDRDKAREADRDHIAGKTPYFEQEFRMRRKDGDWIWILDRGKVVARDENANPTRMIGTHVDITRRKKQEEERRILTERMAIATDSGGIGIWDYDLIKNLVTWDPWMYRLFGLPERTGERVPDLWRRHIHRDDFDRIEEAVRQAIVERRPLNDEYRIIRPDNSTHYIRISAKVVVNAEGDPLRLIGAAWDVTAQRRMATELAEQHELMRVTLHSIGDAVMTTDALGIVQWLNPIAERMTGWSASDAVGQSSTRVFNIINEETRQRAPDPIAACLRAQEVVGLDENTMLVALDGREFSIEDSAAPIRNSDGDILGAVLVFHDVSEQRRLSREMRYRASHDPLTGLVNRAEFDRRLEDLFERSRLTNCNNTLLYIDLDQFKIVNDSCGHAVGDELLKQVSKILASAIRNGDTLARLGGDEFAVILEACNVGNAARIAQVICDRMAEFRFVHDEKRFRVGTSIGVVPVDDTMSTLASILQAADNACYAAKEAGRNRVHVWIESDKALAERSLEMRWASRIERALDDELFVLFAQSIRPVSQPKAGRHVELLIRMQDEDGKLVAPSAFLPSAERFNLITKIDRWVLNKAIALLTDLPWSGEAQTFSLNLSGHSIGDRTFHREALRLLDIAGPSVCGRLCIEITETAAVTNLADATIFIDHVRKRGVRVALDDFGAGASSFGYLKQFTVDYLKIDGQFIRGITEDPLSQVTVRCFVDVARTLGIKTVAEYVENADTLASLASIGVDYAQGFHIHKPEPLSDLFTPELANP